MLGTAISILLFIIVGFYNSDNLRGKQMNKRILGIAALLALSFALPTGALAQGDATKGEKEFKKCMSCHSIEEGGKNKTGPNLWNVMNRGVSKVEDLQIL